MSLKWKLFLIVIISMFATAGAGVYFSQHQPVAHSLETNDGKAQEIAATQISHDPVNYPERTQYKTIPLTSLNTNLQGSDPATLALNIFEETVTEVGTRKVEVAYPQHNQALVTITQVQPSNNPVSEVKYRVEMNTFGRSLLVSSPPVWEIVWAGSKVQCQPGNRPQKNLILSCQPATGE
ncbi:hypothetical protein H6G41_07095 [Tolypothrix sp. FACHB-123]|nr:hypothetical protein [Tolypothrix sp. FACHB-123]